jgi:hypothetical protein
MDAESALLNVLIFLINVNRPKYIYLCLSDNLSVLSG